MNLPSACIFDMDELLLASVPQWRAAIDLLLSTLGENWTPELAAKYQGRNASDVACVIHSEFRPSLSVEECQKILHDELLKRFADEELVPMPGAIECVRRLSQHFPLAVASGSPLPVIEIAMERLGITSCFSAILSSESVARGKPEPDVFLEAARLLDAEPARCVVFEDSLAGVRAARAAGMKVVVVPSAYDQEEVEKQANKVLGSLDEVDLDTLRMFPN